MIAYKPFALLKAVKSGKFAVSSTCARNCMNIYINIHKYICAYQLSEHVVTTHTTVFIGKQMGCNRPRK